MEGRLAGWFAFGGEDEDHLLELIRILPSSHHQANRLSRRETSRTDRSTAARYIYLLLCFTRHISSTHLLDTSTRHIDTSTVSRHIHHPPQPATARHRHFSSHPARTPVSANPRPPAAKRPPRSSSSHDSLPNSTKHETRPRPRAPRRRRPSLRYLPAPPPNR